MSILSDIGTKIGTELNKKLDTPGGVMTGQLGFSYSSWKNQMTMWHKSSSDTYAWRINDTGDGIGNKDVLTVNRSGVVNFTNNPTVGGVPMSGNSGYSFNMSLSGTQNTYTNSVNGAIPFNHLLSGSITGWSTSTYRWTASVAGTYLVSAVALISSAKSWEIQIAKNSTFLSRLYNANDRQVSGSILVDMSIGDYIYIGTTEACYLHSASPYSTLTITYQS